jgi:Fe-S-cluster containining protein
MTEDNSCSCEGCQRACTIKPGWFLPGEAEEAAKLKNMTLPDFFNKYLGVDWHGQIENTDKDVFLLAPATTKMKPGNEYFFDPHGQCVFYVNGKCDIHEAKPYECKEYFHDQLSDSLVDRHYKVAEKWNTPANQKQIQKLLGHSPKANNYLTPWDNDYWDKRNWLFGDDDY